MELNRLRENELRSIVRFGFVKLYVDESKCSSPVSQPWDAFLSELRASQPGINEQQEHSQLATRKQKSQSLKDQESMRYTLTAFLRQPLARGIRLLPIHNVSAAMVSMS